MKPDTARLFPHYAAEDLDPGRAGPFLIERLLEDGDGADLRWLAARFSEGELKAWLARHGGRRLSARSRAFWQTVLAAPAGPPAAAAPDLWPL